MLKSIHLCNWSYKCTNSNTVLNLTFVMIGGLVTVCYNAFFFSGFSLWAHLDHLCNHFLAIFSSCWGILGHFWVILAIFCHLLSNPPPPTYFSLFSSIFQYYIFYPTFREITALVNPYFFNKIPSIFQ